MALIQYVINRAANGGVSVVSTIKRIDPGDQLILTSNEPAAALQWKNGSPLAPPAADNIFPLPLVTGSAEPVKVLTQMDPTEALAQCGNQNAGAFTPWTQAANGFPGGGGTQRVGN
jgi:hypothetical protein